MNPSHFCQPSQNGRSTFPAESLQLLIVFTLHQNPHHHRQLSCQSRPRPVIPVTQTDCLSRLFPLLREGTSTRPTPGRPPCQKTATSAELAAPPPSRAWQRSNAAHACWVSATCGCRAAVTKVSRPCLSLCDGPSCCHSVSVRLKQVCAQRAVPQHTQLTRRRLLIFIIPPPNPPEHTHMLTGQECSGDANTSVRLRRSVDAIDYVNSMNLSTGKQKRLRIIVLVNS